MWQVAGTEECDWVYIFSLFFACIYGCPFYLFSPPPLQSAASAGVGAGWGTVTKSKRSGPPDLLQ